MFQLPIPKELIKISGRANHFGMMSCRLCGLGVVDCRAEKDYINYKVQTRNDFSVKNILRNDFKYWQKCFDKRYRYFKRKQKKEAFTLIE